MRRHGDLFDKITSFENLLAAERAAYRGKRRRPAPVGFHFDLEPNLFILHADLHEGTYEPGAYRAFWIHDPKKRLISAAPYRDRATEFCRQWPYALKCDVEKFFPSVDHEILLELVARKIKCPRTLDLLGKIVRARDQTPSSPPWEGGQLIRYFPGDDLFTPHERRRGLPIGNLTSQFLANVMLDPLDHYLKETLRWPAQLRFADDFLVFGDDKRALAEVLIAIRRFLAPLRLRVYPRKCVILPVRLGVPFLGWRVFTDHRRLRRSTGVRFQRRLKELAAAYRRGEVSLPEVRASVASWNGHLKHGDTWGLRKRLLRATVFTRSPLGSEEGSGPCHPERSEEDSADRVEESELGRSERRMVPEGRSFAALRMTHSLRSG